MQRRGDPSFVALFGVILLFAALGTPMFLFLWETVNDVLRGEPSAWRIGVSLPVLALFAGLLTLLSRTLSRWGGTPPGPRP